MADDSRDTDPQTIDSAINELAERKNGKRNYTSAKLNNSPFLYSSNRHSFC